ncbi:cytochrome c biogenesis CcdA family protein [Hansschlegelia quercus]|uniref:Cytochrome c biogenesis protein CcdA n=1 Tax=Hansschlegelia quercus TaxID=2528245 RepID=A0A4Q9GGI3_9HYPH|nr:cytochrome c biogenesis CcdA family protein [Hansschlegelia quercus]TBN47585.1 cytochrome c biogenesis protein CcdA [Hansschlegelia quercus]
MAGTLLLAFLAGLVSILSPCVLPIVPLALGAAASEHRLGPLALASGLALSFVIIGLFVATVGFSIGLDSDVFRAVAAVMMIVVGAVVLLPAAQARFALAAGPAGHWAAERLDGASRTGLSGQFVVGLLLGAVWSPCVGPTLGAASVLAARGENLGAVALTMLVFGLGAAVPLLALGMVSRELTTRWRSRLGSAGRTAKIVLGVLLITVGAIVASGVDKTVETALVQVSPEWLTAFTTRF